MRPRPETLADVPRGGTVMLAAPLLPAGRARRVAELGLRAGCRVTVLLRTAGGGRVIAVEDARIAVDAETLRRLPLGPLEAVAPCRRQVGRRLRRSAARAGCAA